MVNVRALLTVKRVVAVRRESMSVFGEVYGMRGCYIHCERAMSRDDDVEF